MTYAASNSYYPFDSEAQRAAFEAFDWEAAGLAIRGRTQAFVDRFPANPDAAREVRTCPSVGLDGFDWESEGRAIRERTRAFFARHSSGTC